MEPAPRIQWVGDDESQQQYHERSFCSMSRLAKALRLREQVRWHEHFVEMRREERDERPSEFGARMMRVGQQYEALVWRALLHYVPHWRACGVQARAAEMYVSSLDKPLIGCTDYILFRSLLKPPGERAAVEIKVVQRREPPPHEWGEHPPVDYLPQLESCMRSLHCNVAYLCVLNPMGNVALPERSDEADGAHDEVGPRGITCSLHVWEVRRDDRWWQTWAEPRLRLLQQMRTAWQKSVEDPVNHPYRPTRMQTVKASRISADSIRQLSHSRCVLQAVWDGQSWLAPRTHLLRSPFRAPIVRYVEVHDASSVNRPCSRECSEEALDSTTAAETREAHDWLAARATAAPPSASSADTDSDFPGP